MSDSVCIMSEKGKIIQEEIWEVIGKILKSI